MSVYQRSEKKSHLDTIWYEIAMLEFCYSELGKRTGISEPERNLFIEGFLLHYRNIVEFCSGEKHRPARNGKPADLSTADPKVWAHREMTAAEMANIQAPARKLMLKQFEDISQFLQHCTERRFIDAKKWNLNEMITELRPIISALHESFPQKAGRRDVGIVSRDAGSTATFTTFSGMLNKPE